MQPVGGLSEKGSLGYVIHLCGRFPDHNSEVTYAPAPNGTGWHHWYLDPTGFHKWRADDPPALPPFGDEGERMNTVVVEHCSETLESRGFLVRDGCRIQVGATQRMVTHFSVPELKIDATLAGERVEMHVDNVRLYPHPAETPLRIIAMRAAHPGPAPELFVYGVTLRLRIAGRPDLSATTDRNGVASLRLPCDMLYPCGGELTAALPGALCKTITIAASEVRGFYPGDVWALNLD
jgi:hypothetical protein